MGHTPSFQLLSLCLLDSKQQQQQQQQQ